MKDLGHPTLINLKSGSIYYKACLCCSHPQYDFEVLLKIICSILPSLTLGKKVSRKTFSPFLLPFL